MIARILSGLFLMATLALPVDAATFGTTLSGDQEVPPVNSAATGSATLVLNDDAQDRLEINIQFTGLDLDGTQTPETDDDVTVAHIQRAPAGANGPVVRPEQRWKRRSGHRSRRRHDLQWVGSQRGQRHDARR